MNNLLVILLITLVTCSIAHGEPTKDEKTLGSIISSKDYCAKHGGQWNEGTGYSYCRMPYSDAGKACRSGADCFGLCITPLDGKPIMKGVGICKDNSPQSAEDGLSLTIKALIGKRIPAIDADGGNRIPDWNIASRYSLTSVLEVDEIYQNNMSAFAVLLRDSADDSRTVVDAVELQQYLLSYVVENGKQIQKNSNRMWYFNGICKTDNNRHMVGLMRPNPNATNGKCTHWSKKVDMVWEVDIQTGRLLNKLPQNVSCEWKSEMPSDCSRLQ
jgi:hypothetical protein